MSSDSREWDELAEVDALWAVLTEPGRKSGGWSVEEFLATGEQELAGPLERAAELGLPGSFGRALDVGCGVGRVTRALADRFGECVGIDASEAMVRNARRINEDRPNCSFHQLSAADLDSLDAGTFDLVWSVLVLQHLSPPDAERAVSSFMSVLNPGGVAIFQLPYAARPLRRLQLSRRLYRLLRAGGASAAFLLRRTPLTPMRMIALDEQRVRQLLDATGGEVRAVDEYGDQGAYPSRLYFAAAR